ncbi:hypothetical protein [Streptomyces sp. CBMA156]|uniref:hypothetical protein n=1 Tax=Streptomyces sp. CBMA156 TaxID=1930280 RepID=UPI0016620D20|nr:hypothetical protein [Streptomyces sp. CBMA156]MBD0669950.1 hypothetical protein [Streptomyces sp. CBMA156]MBD0670515.1 hypothetical protein [Streptomyces sp. CBMA156]
MSSTLSRATAEQRRQAADVLDDLTTVLALGGVRPPTLEVDWHTGRLTCSYLLHLTARPADLLRVVDLLRKGLRHERLTHDD